MWTEYLLLSEELLSSKQLQGSLQNIYDSRNVSDVSPLASKHMKMYTQVS